MSASNETAAALARELEIATTAARRIAARQYRAAGMTARAARAAAKDAQPSQAIQAAIGVQLQRGASPETAIRAVVALH